MKIKRGKNKLNLRNNGNAGLFSLFVVGLATMHSAERQLGIALPLVRRAVRSEDLKKLVDIHLQETKGHLKTIEVIADSLAVELPGKTCRITKALIKTCVGIMIKMHGSEVMDIALAATAQKIEHYEIASYGALCSWAEQMGLSHEHALLKSVLGQEKLADELLTGVAQHTDSLGKLIQRASLKRVKRSIKPPGL